MGDFISDVESILNGGTWDKCGSQPPYIVGKLSKEDIVDFGYRIDALADQTRMVTFDNTDIAEKQRGVVQAWSITKTERDNIENDILGIMQASNDVYRVIGISRSTHLDRCFTTITIERLAVLESWIYSYMAGGIQIKTPFTIYDNGNIVFAITSNTGTPTNNYVLIWDNVNQCLKWASVFDADAIHDNVSGEINALSEKASPVDADLVIIEDSESSYAKKKVQLSNLPGGAGGGEANTASSAGSGTSIYYTKVGVDLKFNAIKSENNLLTVSLDSGTHDVEFTINEGNFNLANIGGELALGQLAAGSQGSIIKRGAADWEELVKGTNGYFLKSGAGDISWAQLVEADITDLGSYLENIVEDLTPQLGGDLDLNQKCIEFDETPTSNQTGHGFIITDDVDENTQGFGNALHLDSDGNWIDAHADAAATMPCKGLALESGTGAGKKILLHGIIRDDAWDWTPGNPIYISDTASGDLTQTAPADTGEIIQIVGWALSADVIYFNPDNVYIELV